MVPLGDGLVDGFRLALRDAHAVSRAGRAFIDGVETGAEVDLLYGDAVAASSRGEPAFTVLPPRVIAGVEASDERLDWVAKVDR